MAGKRPRHQDKDIEQYIREIESAGWIVTKTKVYYKALCHCGVHRKTIHLTPSGGYYLQNLKGWFKRVDCWKEDI